MTIYFMQLFTLYKMGNFLENTIYVKKDNL